jgi:hypothetical protein
MNTSKVGSDSKQIKRTVSTLLISLHAIHIRKVVSVTVSVLKYLIFNVKKGSDIKNCRTNE